MFPLEAEIPERQRAAFGKLDLAGENVPSDLRSWEK